MERLRAEAGNKDEMVGWHHRLKGHGFEQTPGHNGGQGSLVCCSSWGFKESDMTWQLKNNKNSLYINYTFIKLLKNQQVVIHGPRQEGVKPRNLSKAEQTLKVFLASDKTGCLGCLRESIVTRKTYERW